MAIPLLFSITLAGGILFSTHMENSRVFYPRDAQALAFLAARPLVPCLLPGQIPWEILTEFHEPISTDIDVPILAVASQCGNSSRRERAGLAQKCFHASTTTEDTISLSSHPLALESCHIQA